ncbi:MAG: TonB-dependent receptor, partial [Bacteroidetes Order II. Incertae sedis bacterium]|nr:TonB-dependent receptor [Bacteroidetes Order II. bacterium]
DRGAGITRGDITELVPGAFASGALFFSQNPFGTAPGGGVEPFTEDQIIIDGKHTVSTRTDFNQATRDEFGLDATVEYELDNGVMLKSITAYKDYESELQYDLGGTAMQMFPNLQAEGNKQFTQEFQILSSAEDRTRYVAGVFYLDNESENEQYVAFGEHMYFIPVPTGAETRLNADLSTRSMAIFGNVTHDLTDTTSIFAGLRYSDIEKEIKVSQSDSVFIFGLINLPNHKQKLSDDFVSWTVGVNHRIETEAFEINLYAKSSQGYKEGGFTTRLLSLSEIGGDINNPNMGFDREEVLEYEVGMKGMFFEDRLRLNLAYYDLDYKDIQTTRLDDNDFSRITNGPSATSKGFELDSTYIISQYFRLVTSVGRSEAKYGTFTNCSPTRDCSGNYLPFSSEWTVSTSLDFQYPLEIFNWTLFGGLDYNYRSPRYTNPGNVFPPSANRFFNAQIGLRSEETGLQLLLMGKNLRDEDNILSETRDNTFGHVSTRYGVPRSWTAQLTYSF